MYRFCRRLGGFNLGLERSRVDIHGAPYLDRWILYVAGFSLRVHKFHRGDDDRASHTHPWWFITFPLQPYVERVFRCGRETGKRVVHAGCVHYRPADFEHIVVGGVRPSPVWTLVLTGRRSNSWGFYPHPGEFIYWRDYQ